MNSLARLALYAAGVCGWLLAMLAVLQLAQVDLAVAHAVCGPWGCGPSLEALIACHGFWLVLLAPPAAVAARRTSLGALRLVSVTAIVLALAGIGGVFLWQAMVSLPRMLEGEAAYFVRRCLFVIGTTVEFPLMQLLLVGMGGWLYADRRRHRFIAAQQRPIRGSES